MGKYVPLDLAPEVVERIDRIARDEERSRAAMIRQLIKRALALYDGDPVGDRDRAVATQ